MVQPDHLSRRGQGTRIGGLKLAVLQLQESEIDEMGLLQLLQWQM